MFGLIKKVFVILLTSIVNASNRAKRVSKNNQKCMTQPTLINLQPNECTNWLSYYLFAVNLDRCVGSCNTLNDLSNKVYAPKKTQDLNSSVFNVLTEINDWKTLIKHILLKCVYRFDGRKCNSNQKRNNNRHWCECKNLAEHCLWEKVIFGILLHVVAKMLDMKKYYWQLLTLVKCH